MSLLSRFLRTEQRAIDASQFALGDDLFPSRTDSGMTVTKDTATRLVAVLACQGLIADSISTMPVDLFRRSDSGRVPVARPPSWLEFPNDDQHLQAFVETIVMELLSSGNAFVQIAARDSLFYPSQLRVTPSEEFVVRRENGSKRLFHMPTGRYVDMFSPSRPGGEYLHIAGLSDNGLFGLSPIEKAQQAIGLGLATEKFGAKFFGAGAQVSGVLEMPPGSLPTDAQLQALAREFRRKFSSTDNAWRPLVLGNGASWKPVTLPNDQAQFIESRKFSVSEIARLYRVPPHMIGDVEKSTSWGSGIEEQGIGFVQYTLTSWIRRLELALSQLVPINEYLKWNVNALMRGDTVSRYQAHATAIQSGFLSRNEARALEDRLPVNGLDDFLIPVNVAKPSSPDGLDPETANAMADVVGKYIRAGFTAESSLAAAVSGDPNRLVHTGLLPVTLAAEEMSA